MLLISVWKVNYYASLCAATDPASNTLRGQGFHVGSSVVVLSEQGDGVPDLSRVSL